MAYGVGRVSGGPQILDGDHSSRVVMVDVVDYVRGDTKASAVHSTSTPSAPVAPAKRRKFDYPSPSLAPGPSTSVSMATFTFSSSNTTFSASTTQSNTHTYSNIHRILDLIDFRGCVVTQTSVRVRELEAWEFGQTANRKKFCFKITAHKDRTSGPISLSTSSIGTASINIASQYSRIFTDSLTASQMSIVGSIHSKQKASASSFSFQLLDAIPVLTSLYTGAIPQTAQISSNS
ncbi:hypothetical protein B0H14DRAFT_2575586 [Mycena olivaceomarginata]|nr:hypothetical protein B0H14DRAFT_2575586 [Mycena olivaceomarginata]